MSMWNFSSLRLHCKIKSKASHKFQSLIKIHITFMIGLFAKQIGTKISLSDPGKSQTCVSSLRQLRRFNGNYQLSQLSQFFFGNDYGNQDGHMETRFKLTCPKGKGPGRPSSNKIIN